MAKSESSDLGRIMTVPSGQDRFLLVNFKYHTVSDCVPIKDSTNFESDTFL